MSEKKEADVIKGADKAARPTGIVLASIPAMIGIVILAYVEIYGYSGSTGYVTRVIIFLSGWLGIGTSALIFIFWGIVAAVSKAKSNNAEQKDE